MSQLTVKERVFLLTVQTGSVAAVRRLLSEGHSPNVAAARPEITPLHEAVIQGDMLLIKTLVAAGADLNAPNAQGDFPLDTAIYEDQDAAARYLRGLGARRHDEDDLSPPAPAEAQKPQTVKSRTARNPLPDAFEQAAREELQRRFETPDFRYLPRRGGKPPAP